MPIDEKALDTVMLEYDEDVRAFSRAAFRPLLDAYEAAKTQQPDQTTCHLCDCTGDIHRLDGEWQGSCPYCTPKPKGESLLRRDRLFIPLRGWLVLWGEDGNGSKPKRLSDSEIDWLHRAALPEREISKPKVSHHDMAIATDFPDGTSLYVQKNEVGGYTYYSDEIGGGVMVWDTSLVAEKTLRAAIEHNKRNEVEGGGP